MNKSEFPVLLIEDNPDDVILIRRAFDRANLTRPLVAVSDSESAEAFLSSTGSYFGSKLPVLIILNLKMPGRSGLEVLAWLRSQNGLRYIPVVVLSGSENPKHVDRAYDLGANSYVCKTGIASEVLTERVEGLLKFWLECNFIPHDRRVKK